MWAMIEKEFRQLRRDRRTLAMMIVMPLMLLVIFGYAASFDVSSIPTVVVGPEARQLASILKAPLHVLQVRPTETLSQAECQIRAGHAEAVFVADEGQVQAYVDGSDLFSARAVETAVGQLSARQLALQALGAQAMLAKLKAAAQAGQVPPQIVSAIRPRAAAPMVHKLHVLYNPGLKTAVVMVPGLAGVILVFIGTLIASLGVVRERQSGTLEQLAVMPLSPWDVLIGKIAPYFLVSAVDLLIVLGAGMWLFSVPLHGSWLILALGALLFLFVTLSLGVLISSVSQNQGQAMQLAMMAVLPQILLSGLIFPISSMAGSVRWIAYILPLTYFIEIARGVMLRGAPIADLWQPFLYLGLLGAVVVSVATLRFHRLLSPTAGRGLEGSL